ncbi:MAG: MBL fold metallo-hydrolase [Thermoplasmata archaeon]|nr:MAG: MBL fold metallo-hydrolase [Thermoplasmata archaeon]
MIIFIPGRGFDSNVYLIKGQKNTVIDTGSGFDTGYILDELKKNIDIHDIDQIILTHEHVDHTGGAEHLRKKLDDVKILAHEEVARVLEEGIEPSALLFSLPSPKVDVDIKLKDGDRVKIGDDTYIVLHTPGHSKGSICLYCDEKKTLFSGDTIFAYGGIGRYDLPGGDLMELQKSIQRLSELDVKNLYPGHGDFIREFGNHHVKLALRSVRYI